MARCVECDNQAPSAEGGKIINRGVYVGETSHPVRERIIEHMDNLRLWSQTSLIITHWMLEHSTQTKPPEFNFKVLSAYPDALRRQISEGLNILDTGILSKKLESSQNKIHRMLTSKEYWDGKWREIVY